MGWAVTDSASPSKLVQDWFAVAEVEPGIFRIGEPLHQEDVKSHLVVGVDRAILIDTGMGVGDLRALVEQLTDLPVSVVNSHAHWDHVGANWRFDDISIHRAEADRLARGVDPQRLRRAFADEYLRGPLPPGIDRKSIAIPPSAATTLLDGGEVIDLGNRRLEVIHAPGHSPGGIVLLDRDNGVLFSTDVAYPGMLYGQQDDSDLDDYCRSMRILADLAPSLRMVYPSHDASPMDPALLPKMSEALDSIAAGRNADAVMGSVLQHFFDGFSVLVRADDERPK
jgi:glyoxylase-like metal-dependent hydrolase (beta-lactamase superfamily II)